MTRWPPFLSPGWLAAYAIGGLLWRAIGEVTPLAVIVVVASLGALGIVALGNLFDSGHALPPEERR